MAGGPGVAVSLWVGLGVPGADVRVARGLVSGVSVAVGVAGVSGVSVVVGISVVIGVAGVSGVAGICGGATLPVGVGPLRS